MCIRDRCVVNAAVVLIAATGIGDREIENPPVGNAIGSIPDCRSSGGIPFPKAVVRNEGTTIGLGDGARNTGGDARGVKNLCCDATGIVLNYVLLELRRFQSLRKQWDRVIQPHSFIGEKEE